MASPPSSSASITSVTTFFSASGALESGQVTLLRGGLETTKRLLHVRMLAGGFDQLLVQRRVVSLCFDCVVACLFQ